MRHDERVDQRRTRRIGPIDKACDICGHAGLVLTESRAVRRGAALLNPAWKAQPRSYELCPHCGVRYRLEDGQRV